MEKYGMEKDFLGKETWHLKSKMEKDLLENLIIRSISLNNLVDFNEFNFFSQNCYVWGKIKKE